MNYVVEVSEGVLTSTPGKGLEIISKLDALRERGNNYAVVV